MEQSLPIITIPMPAWSCQTSDGQIIYKHAPSRIDFIKKLHEECPGILIVAIFYKGFIQ